MLPLRCLLRPRATQLALHAGLSGPALGTQPLSRPRPASPLRVHAVVTSVDGEGLVRVSNYLQPGTVNRFHVATGESFVVGWPGLA